MNVSPIQISFRKPRQAAIDLATKAGEPLPIHRKPVSVAVNTIPCYVEQKNDKGEVTGVKFDASVAQASVQALFAEAQARGPEALSNLFQNLADLMLGVQLSEIKSFFDGQDADKEASLENFDPAAFDLVTLMTTIEEREGAFELTEELAKAFAADYVAVGVEVLGKKQSSLVGHLTAYANNFKFFKGDLEKNGDKLRTLLAYLAEYNSKTSNDDARAVGKHYHRKLNNLLNPKKRKTAEITELQFE